MYIKPCKHCKSSSHYSFQCFSQRKPIKKLGAKALSWSKFRDNIAIPYLDKTYGHVCRKCGVGGDLDVNHIKSRGSHPELRLALSNLEYLCRSCHRSFTDHT